MKLSEFDYQLPEELIAQQPLAERDGSRLLVLERAGEGLQHRLFRELPMLLRAGDLLVLNDARVIPARLLGRKVRTGGKVELLVLSPDGARPAVWRCMGQASKPLRPGMELDFDGLRAQVLGDAGEGTWDVQFETDRLPDILERVGRVPLPPYIRREPRLEDRERYQTVFARRPGAVAAPTAGLHFTTSLLEALRHRDVRIAQVTLYVGAGTFLPIRTEVVEEHRMHSERFDVSAEAAEAVTRARREGRRVVAVGTTALRTLESAWDGDRLRAGEGESELFIYPGHRFRAVDGLITNFHLPRSTLLLLVCALAGRERILEAYREAVQLRYRFFSYGDAMLIL